MFIILIAIFETQFHNLKHLRILHFHHTYESKSNVHRSNDFIQRSFIFDYFTRCTETLERKKGKWINRFHVPCILFHTSFRKRKARTGGKPSRVIGVKARRSCRGKENRQGFVVDEFNGGGRRALRSRRRAETVPSVNGTNFLLRVRRAPPPPVFVAKYSRPFSGHRNWLR